MHAPWVRSDAEADGGLVGQRHKHDALSSLQWRGMGKTEGGATVPREDDMSLKAIKEAVEVLRDVPGRSPFLAQVADRAEASIAALEKAAKAWTRPMASDRSEWEAMGQLLTTIAKEAE